MAKDHSCGLVNNIDEMGRVEIPREYRKLLDIKEGSRIEIGILDGGKIVGKGSHTELYNNCLQYKDMYDSQYEELKNKSRG